MTTEPASPIRVRFAPSPTGFLHVGGARTAIYNDLLRQRLGRCLRAAHRGHRPAALGRGDDAARSRRRWPGSALPGTKGRTCRVSGPSAIASAPRSCWRADLPTAPTRRPTSWRPCAPRRGRRAETFRYRESRTPLSTAEIERRAASGRPHVVRFRMPDDMIRFGDLVRGDVEFPPDALDDLILLRSDGSPTYHMSVVTDDIDMEITHVIRGEDHLSNTPKHVAMFEAFGAAIPTFAHLPLILGHGSQAALEAHRRDLGGGVSQPGHPAPGALQLLALLGWTPGDDREVMSRARDDRGVHDRATQRLGGGVRPEKLGVDERPVHVVVAARGAAAPPRAVSRRRRARWSGSGAPGRRFSNCTGRAPVHSPSWRRWRDRTSRRRSSTSPP